MHDQIERMKRELLEALSRWQMDAPDPPFATVVRRALAVADFHGKRHVLLGDLARAVGAGHSTIEGWADGSAGQPKPRIQETALLVVSDFLQNL